MSAEDEVTAMQVETDDFIYSLTAGDADGNEQTEIITSDHSGIPADLVHTDVSDLENNASLWLDGLEGALESNDGVSNMPHHVTSHLVEDHAQMSESMAHMTEVEGVEPNSLGVAEVEGHAELEGQSQEVENVTMEPMDVDVQTTEVSSIELTEMRLENFMEQTDVGINPDSSSTVTKEDVPLIPVTLSLPSVEPRAILPSVQQRKTTITIPSSSQVTKVVLSPAGQNQSGQPLLFTVPSSATGLTSLLTPSANLRFVNAVGSSGGTKVTNVGSSLASGATSHPMRLMSPTKTITLQQAQQLGLISPKKGQSLVINKVTMASGGPSTTSSALLTGKPGAKFAGGNVTLVRSAPTKTPTKIAPAPPQSVVTTVASSSTATQPTSLLIKNAAGQVTMATLVQARPNSAGIANLGTMSPQKFVLRPATPGSIASAQVRQGSGAPAQYIRLTTAQALAAGILPAVGAHSDGSHQQLQLAGNKIQLVRVVTPSQIAANNSSGNIAVSNSSKMVLGSSSSTVKITTHSLAQSQANKSIMSSVSKPQVKISTSSSQTGVPPGVQRILLPAGSMSSISNNIVMLPAHYSSQNLASAGSNANVAISLTTNTNTMVSDATSLPVMSSTSARSSFSTKNYVSPPSPESSQPSTPGSKTQGVLESNGLKPRKPCNCTKSQCLKLYCDCFANGEFCHGCNCVCCANNLEHEELRLRAIRSCLDRNPHAFKPKIGVGWGPEPRRHNKGCHCKRSGCLKNYCECYEAKIACSAICKCIGCKNCVDPIASPPGTGEKRNSKVAALISHPSNTPEGRTVSNIVPQSSIKVEERTSDPPKGSATTASSSSSRPPFSFITQEVVEATCQCLLAQAEEAERQCKSSVETEGLVLEEFGRCLLQIIEYASKAKVTASP